MPPSHIIPPPQPFPVNKSSRRVHNRGKKKQNADLWLYPDEKDVELRGEDHLTVYRFARMGSGHAFCSTCGVPVVNMFDHSGGKLLSIMAGKLPVNARTINGVDVQALKVRKADGKNLRGPEYKV